MDRLLENILKAQKSTKARRRLPENVDKLFDTESSNGLPSGLSIPSYLINIPFSYSADDADNIWMEELSDDERKIDLDRSMRQHLDLYHFLASEALVMILPTPQGASLQDLVFVANIGIVLEHLQDTVVISNFTAEPRKGETEIGKKFFESMRYKTIVSPFKFEGEAELKHLHDNIYCGGYGIRSDIKAYYWMEEQFNMKVIKLQEKDEYLYHLDCTIFPITREKTFVCTELFDDDEIKEIENYTEIIDVSMDDCYAGICNNVRLYNMILNASRLHELQVGDDEYNKELHKDRKLQDIASELGFEVVLFNLSEYLKGGAVLSCLVMHLNRNSYEISLL